jgi:hypothetical protein
MHVDGSFCRSTVFMTVTRLRRLAIIPLLLTLSSFAHATSACSGDGPTAGCCKVCKEGKPCGDSCIAKSETCHVGAGCACSGLLH